MKTAGKATGIALVAFCLYLLAGAVFCAATLHVGRRVGPAPPGAASVSILASDGARLDAWWMRGDSAGGTCVMVLHGISDSRVGSAGFAPMFLAEGYSVLFPDSRSHGTSEGALVTYGLLEKYDTIAWADWLRAQGCRKIYGLGESLGAAVLIQTAAVKPAFTAVVAWLAVHAGMFYARVADGFDFTQVSPINSIAQTATPILLIHGLADTRTPPENSERLAHANPRDPLWLVPNAGHTGASAAELQEFRRRVLHWFATH